jgi:hypothetical protein
MLQVLLRLAKRRCGRCQGAHIYSPASLRQVQRNAQNTNPRRPARRNRMRNRNLPTPIIPDDSGIRRTTPASRLRRRRQLQGHSPRRQLCKLRCRTPRCWRASRGLGAPSVHRPPRPTSRAYRRSTFRPRIRQMRERSVVSHLTNFRPGDLTTLWPPPTAAGGELIVWLPSLVRRGGGGCCAHFAETAEQ